VPSGRIGWSLKLKFLSANRRNLSKDEVKRVTSGMKGVHQLMAKLLYGCGLRLMESLRLLANFPMLIKNWVAVIFFHMEDYQLIRAVGSPAAI
jgi:hypothetical protein